MNQDIFKGRWNEFKGQVKQRWGKLTDNDLMQTQGNFDALVGSIQKNYGITKEKALEEFNSFKDSLGNVVNEGAASIKPGLNTPPVANRDTDVLQKPPIEKEPKAS